MKCEPARHGPCKRCRNSKIECVFKPRANARRSNSVVLSRNLDVPEAASSEVLERLAVIESILGISRNNVSNDPATGSTHSNSPSGIDESETDQALEGLWQTTAILKRYTPSCPSNLWSRSVVSQLWLS
jgi:hypothetical protein